MDHITPGHRYQMLFGTPDEWIAPDERERFQDAFAGKPKHLFVQTNWYYLNDGSFI